MFTDRGVCENRRETRTRRVFCNMSRRLQGCEIIKIACLFVICQFWQTTLAKVVQEGGRASGSSARYEGNIHDVPVYEEFDIVIPYEYEDHGGSSISNNIHRSKRSLDSIKRKDKIKIGFVLKGQEVTLSLEKTKDLIIPGAIIEYVSNNETSARVLPDEQCYYKGRVNDAENSFAAVSTCDGLLGVFKTEDSNEYFIEPKKTGGSLQHAVYRTNNNTTKHREQKNKQKPVGNDEEGDDVYSGNTTGRAKRHTGSYHLEVLLVADNTVAEFHGNSKVKQYLLTLMNIVNSAYQHPSLGIKLHVVVIKMMLVDSYVANQILWRGDARRTLDRFCKWAEAIRPRDVNSPQYHDHAIFITRDDLGPAGYAPVNGMCRTDRSCAVTKDDGLSSAFVMAHETGHVLGMEHDGQRNRCGGDTSSGSIMAPLVQATFSRYYWSSCSRAELGRLLRSYTCLMDDPFEPSWPRISIPYGKSWPMDEQCRQEFGEGYKLCHAFRTLDPCELLWCSTPNNPLLCKTKKGPPLPGSDCGQGYWCQDNRCKARNDNTPRNGGWSAWTSWDSCTRTCGGGVRFRRRVCNKPTPLHGGRRCRGEDEAYELCENTHCPTTTKKDFRSEQCSRYNNQYRNGRYHSWQPYIRSHGKSCDLLCISEATGEIVDMKKTVVDGTLCNYDNSHDKCIRGKCMKFGCDGIEKSGKRDDVCGVCEGRGNECEKIEGRYEEAIKANEYSTVVVMPKGSRNMLVKRLSYSPHFLALKDQKTGKFLFNGDKRQQYSVKDVIHYGTQFQYSNQAYTEVIKGRGPLLGDIQVLVYPLRDGSKVNIDYQYVLPLSGPNNAIDNSLERYKWKFKHWTKCSKTCGTGEQHIEYSCFDSYDKRRAPIKRCNPLTKPDDYSKKCNRLPCYLTRWVTESWELCSATCGIKGVQTRMVKCIRSVTGKVVEEVSPDYCKKAKPSKTRKCKRLPCPAFWKSGEWSKCSTTCGVGKKRRRVWCDHADDGNKYTCPASQPADTKICTIRRCTDNTYNVIPVLKQVTENIIVDYNLYEWKFVKWTSCTRTCDGGTQHIHYMCRDKQDKDEVPDSYCDPSDKPDISLRKCNRFACPKTRWDYADWQDCSASCGENGVQIRIIACIAIQDGAEHITSHAMCDSKQAPAAQRPCSRHTCDGRTQPRRGGGRTQPRTTTTQQTATVESNELSQPIVQYRWEIYSKWSACSTSCGSTGSRTREVRCMKDAGKRRSRETNAALCAKKKRPIAKQECNRYQCPTFTWEVKKYSACSVTCGPSGVRTRSVRCFLSDRGHKSYTTDSLCEKNVGVKPTSRDLCNRVECPDYRWEADDWTTCSATCGEDGVQRRKVRCMRVDSKGKKEVKSDLCPSDSKRLATRACKTEPCPMYRWKALEWSSCSKTCGDGKQYRDITCIESLRSKEKKISRTKCKSDKQPSLMQSCNVKACSEGTSYKWTVSAWMSCSATCGDFGTKRRRLSCHMVRGDNKMAVSYAYCRRFKKPDQKEACNRKSCISSLGTAANTYRWETKGWSECSSTCGSRGRRDRTVLCIWNNGRNEQPVSFAYCQQHRKPVSYEACNRVDCPEKWSTGRWSRCSKTCGHGKQSRKVYCNVSKCLGIKPYSKQACTLRKCQSIKILNPNCRRDKSVDFCKVATRSNVCIIRAYYMMCCKSCNNLAKKNDV